MKVTFYSAVDNLSLFERVGFYRDDISALKCIGGDLLLTNSVPKGILSFPDLLVAYFYSKSIIIAIACRLIGAKVVLTGGADQISPLLASGWRLRLHKGLAFIGLLAANRILLSCTDDMQNFRKLCFGLTFLQKKLVLANHVVIPATEPQKIGVVHHGRFEAFTLCWMGAEGNVRRKGVDRAVKLIYLLRLLGVDATLDIAGTDGPGRNYIESIIDEFDLGKYVQMIGAISEVDKNRRFSSGGVYLQLSEHEGFGVAAAEAFFSGMVVIHSNRGGLADVIGAHGLIVQLTSIDFEDMSAVSDLYNGYLNYTVDVDYLTREIEKYSLSARAAAFTKGIL